jgi:hypothetical protein
MNKYVFPEFALKYAELTNVQINRLYWSDEYGGSSLLVKADISSNESGLISVMLGEFEYVETYEDLDVMAWALNELEQYRA